MIATTICRYVNLKACITEIPSNGFGANVTEWPLRLHEPPKRLQSIQLDAIVSRDELFRADTKYWFEIMESYVRAFRWKEYNLRNVMDMRAGFGGYGSITFLVIFISFFFVTFCSYLTCIKCLSDLANSSVYYDITFTLITAGLLLHCLISVLTVGL